MPKPDTPTPLLVLSPRSEPPVGESVVQVDLGHFFALVRRVGREPALLLLTIRALRVRMFSIFGLHELSWMLRARNRDVRSWLDQLSQEGLVSYQLTESFGRDALILEIRGEPRIPAPPQEAFGAGLLRVERALPTFWFAAVLPRVGRDPFLVYLLLLRAELSELAVVHPRAIADTLGLRGERHSVRHLRHLRRHGLVKRHVDRKSLVVVDPPPPTRWQRLVLRLVELRLWPRIFVELLVAMILIATLLSIVSYFQPR